MKTPSILISLLLAASGSSFAHEGHDHGLSKEETLKQMKEGKLCVANDIGNAEGAVIEKDGKIFRCVKVYGKNLQQHTELAWVELKLEANGLRTLP